MTPPRTVTYVATEMEGLVMKPLIPRAMTAVSTVALALAVSGCGVRRHCASGRTPPSGWRRCWPALRTPSVWPRRASGWCAARPGTSCSRGSIRRGPSPDRAGTERRRTRIVPPAHRSAGSSGGLHAYLPVDGCRSRGVHSGRRTRPPSSIRRVGIRWRSISPSIVVTGCPPHAARPGRAARAGRVARGPAAGSRPRPCTSAPPPSGHRSSVPRGAPEPPWHPAPT